MISVIGVFVCGFLAGVLFSAWKLETAGPGNPTPKQEAGRQQQQADEVRNRIAGLERMLTVSPDNPDVLIQLGNDYFDIGNHEKAVEYYRKAISLNPRNPGVLTDMGISYRKLGKPKESVEAFRRALEVDPDHDVTLFNLGIVLRDDLQDPQGALKAWETFLEKSPESPHAVMVRPWVKQLRERTASPEPQGSSRKGEPQEK
jgi:tetratricopeptide (TPR) repeat protein